MGLRDKMLSVAMASEQTGMSKSWIRRMCSQGKIKAQKYGHDWIIPLIELKNIIRKRQPNQTKE